MQNNDAEILHQWRQFSRRVNLQKNISPKLKSAINRSDNIRFKVSKEILK
jgi:hypothetical protein